MCEKNNEDFPYRFKKGQTPWNKGTGGCKKGHDPSYYVVSPSGVRLCLMCKRQNGRKYREKNRQSIRLKNRVGRYKMLYSEFQELWNKQNGRCAICGTLFLNDRSYRIDHDHETGKVRGILCASCNTGLGLFKDAPEVLNMASEYLTTHGSQLSD